MPEVVRTVGRYGILRPIGRGGMGVVYLARQQDLDRLVALKEMSALHAEDQVLAQRFVREARLAGSLTDANVVMVFDFFEHEGTPYIAMEYVERGSLRPYVGRMELAQIGGVLNGALAGLHAAEQRGIVHRDLKPENLLVTMNGTVKIADFGIAKATQTTRTSAFATATGTTIGTPQYMAPEQALARDVGPWTDLYSLGCIAYELFGGAPPFHDADTPMAIMMRHISEPLPSLHDLAGVDRDLSDWTAQLTAKDRHARPPSAAAAWEALEEILLVKLGPRWRRESQLADAPSPLVPGALPRAPSAYVTFGFNETTDAPTTPAQPEAEIVGIDLTSSGPDTPESLSRAATAATRPLPQTSGPGDAAAARARRLAYAGVAGLLCAVLLPVFISGLDRWNVFAVLSPFVALGTAAGAWWASRRPGPFAAGLLLGLGIFTSAGALGLVKFAVERLDGLATTLVAVASVSALALLVAGLVRAAGSSQDPPAPRDAGTLVLGLAGLALTCAAWFATYDGFNSLWTELQGGDSAEFVLVPGVAAITILAGFALIFGRPRFATGLLVAAGATTALYFLGLFATAWRRVGEPGEIRPAPFLGVAGGLLVLAASVATARRLR